MEVRITMQEYLEKLQSCRRAEVLDALYSISSSSGNPPQGQVLESLVNLLSHSDADIREQAINTAAIHWRLEAAYKVIVKRFKEEHDQFVLTTMCAALGTLVKGGKGDLTEVNTLLMPIALNDDLDPELRGTAYLSLLRINEKISTKDYASSSHDIESMQLELKWLNSLAAK